MKTFALVFAICTFCDAAIPAAHAHTLPNKIPYAQTQADTSRPNLPTQKSTTQDSTSWFERHTDTLINTIVGAIVTLFGIWVTWQLSHRSERKAPKVAREVKREEILGEHAGTQELQSESEHDVEERYRRGVNKEHGIIKLFGFHSPANLEVRTLEVFVSLRLTEERHDLMPREPMPMTFDHHLSPEKVLQHVWQQKRLLLVLGDPGSGKTTLMKYFAVRSLEPSWRAKLGIHSPIIALLVPLRRINPALDFCESLHHWAKEEHRNITSSVFDKWLEKRGALVMLDGLDEISELEKRKQVCRWIDQAANYYGNSRFIVTTRYTGYLGLELHTSHLRADVLDLDTEQQKIFLQNWYAAAHRQRKQFSVKHAGDTEAEITQQAVELTKAVQRYLDLEENAGLKLMAGTPVLLQLMAILWKEYGNLPPGRATLYAKCIDYLLDQRDREKDLPPPLPADDAKNVLRPLCLWMQENKIDEMAQTQLSERMKERLEEVKPGTSLAKFVEHLIARAGLIQIFGDNGYIFRHKSFREFLAAEALADEVRGNPKRAQILVDNFHENWWRETILFALSLPAPVIFSDFIARYLKSERNASAFPPLLGNVMREARIKSITEFEKFALDQRNHWQKRYNALECLRLIASEPAKVLVKKVWEQEKKEMRLKQKAEEMLIAWKLHRPEPQVIVPIAVSIKAGAQIFGDVRLGEQNFYNSFELDAEYILIKGGTYKYSATKKEVAVPDLYFAKYPVTNKRYRRVIAFLDEKEEAAFGHLPLARFAESLRAKAEKDEDFKKYLSKSPKEWAGLMPSQYDDDKRFNGDEQPVVGVTWFAAMAYCEWLTAQASGIETFRRNVSTVFRLPNEIEWEWAASGSKRKYPWPDDKEPDETRANYQQKVGQTTPVGTYPAGATPEGLMDVAGNVWEWCENLFGEGAAWPKARALRGGSWHATADVLLMPSRSSNLPAHPWSSNGFRVVCFQA